MTYKNRQLLLYSIAIFSITFIVFGYAIDHLWFREDDLGTILNGIIRNWSDAVRVFSADCRSFITPANYQRTAPNVISGFLRPMQNVLFSAVYFFWEVNPYAYYLVHVACHAANAMLFFLLCARFMPCMVARVASLLFAFYPDVAWLTWIGTVQNSLATLFLLACLLVAHRGLSAFFFLCSLLSREIAIFLPVWFFIGAYRQKNSIKKACTDTWMFFAANGVYTLMRLWAFGVGTLLRTFRNLALRYPWLAQHIGPVNNATVQQTISSAQIVHTEPIVPVTTTAQTITWSLMTFVYDRFCSWFQAFFNVSLQSPLQCACAVGIAISLTIFLWCAYKNQRLFLLWLCFGMACVAWPGVLAYPSPRYINMVYPFLIFIIMYGVNCARKGKDSYLTTTWIIFAAVLPLLIWGGCANWRNIRVAGYERVIYKKRFDDFFNRYSFKPATQFVIVSSPFVSDIQSIFQAYLHNLTTVVVFDPFATFAEYGVMGCRKAYVVQSVASKVIPISHGFRLISLEPEKCAWWLRFSDHPIAWSAQHKAYEWTSQQYQEGIWYACSIGRFFIHKKINDDAVSDISFVFDTAWITPNTVFVAWNSLDGCYELISGDHFFQANLPF